jgi:hypothetical protein
VIAARNAPSVRHKENGMRFKPAYGAIALALFGLAAAPTTGHAQQPNQAVQNPGSPQGDTQPAGSEPPHGNPGPTGDTTSHAPIGSGPETMPAKFDPNVAARDRVPIMARPLPLSAEQKQQIYDSVMNTQLPAAQTDASPATILPPTVELSALPGGMEDRIPALRGYKYVKLPDKVLIVAPANRVVVGKIER